MTQNASLKRSVPDPQPDATRTSRIDAWLDAAVAEQAARNAGAARDPRSGSAPPAIPAPAPAVQSEPSRPTERSSDGAPSPLEDSLRDFESRIRTISDRLAAPRPAPRPVPASVPEIEAAITEIRAHKAQLEAGTALGRAPSHAVSASRPRAMPQVESLRKEIAGLRGTIGSLARREDLGDVERSVAHLADQVAALREDGVAPARLDELRADIARMAEIGAPVDHTKLARSIDILSHKLDMAAVGGSVDATSLAPLTRQIDELRSLLAGLATPDDMRAIADQIGALRASLGEIAQRQVPASEVQALRQAVEGLGARLDRTGPGSGPDMSRMQDMLVLLADKLDRVESRVSDPAALDALEQQIAAMAGLGAGSGPRDPALATLETAMSRLLGEVATWRETTVELADRAARTALDAARDEAAMPTGSGEGAGFAARLATLRDAQDALAARTLERLDKVQLALDDLARRMDTTPARTEPHVAESRAGAAAVAKDELPLRPAAPKPDRNDRRASAALPDEADRPLPPPVPEDEILLEPGQRPGAARPTAPSPDADGREIKSSFIAAARRAAQAAAAEASAGRTKGGARAPELPPLKSGEGSPADLRARIKHAFERHRRPLLIGAAAIILALGGLQLGRGFLGGTSVQQAAAPAPAPVVTKPVADPTTTQSLAERPARPAPAPTPSPAPVAEPVAPA
ncbi:MAG: hypothetical protein JO048_16820, partial [Methylobacteriaceae bacterium]|nr:hypothetical protein [Methylobacteriaceae bacterium]